jgi:hypothetical protein
VNVSESALAELVARARQGHRITRAEIESLVDGGQSLDAIFVAFAAAADGPASRSLHHALALLRSFTAPKP